MGGCCTQPDKDKSGRRQCNGSYKPQVNPVNGVWAKCALAGKGIRYWQVVPDFLHLDNEADYVPCPFAGPWYQWMRNLATANEIANAEGKQAGVAIVYADHPKLKMTKLLKSGDWPTFIRNVRVERIGIATLSYQSLVERAMQSELEGHEQMGLLLVWIQRKIQSAAGLIAP